MKKLEEQELLTYLLWWYFLDPKFNDSKITGATIPKHLKCKDVYYQIKAIVKQHFKEKDGPLVTIKEMELSLKPNKIQRRYGRPALDRMDLEKRAIAMGVFIPDNISDLRLDSLVTMAEADKIFNEKMKRRK